MRELIDDDRKDRQEYQIARDKRLRNSSKGERAEIGDASAQ
jgi:hypothetical protein